MDKENNKLIAEFLGYKHICKEDPDFVFLQKGEDLTEVASLKYHKDWNSLIPVLNKIEYILEGFVSEANTEGDNKLEEFYNFNSKSLIFRENMLLIRVESIEIVYKDVVKFIKFYNKL